MGKQPFTVRLEEADRAKLEEIATQLGLNVSALIRMWVKQRLDAELKKQPDKAGK